MRDGSVASVSPESAASPITTTGPAAACTMTEPRDAARLTAATVGDTLVDFNKA